MSESTTAKEIRTREQIAVVDKVLTTAYEDCGNAKYQLSKLAKVNKPNKSNTTSKTINNDKI